MPNRRTHIDAGAIAGTATALVMAREQSGAILLAELAGGMLGGALGGAMPDVLEPATSPNHRKLAHSLVTAGAKRDATKPTVTYVVTNGGNYTVDQTVSVTCTPYDNLSGVQSSTCTNVSADAYTFALGTTNFSAISIDKAGNTSLTATTSITVSVTPGSLCKLVERWVDNHGVANSLCVKLDHHDYEPFRNELDAQSGKKISAEHAAILLRLVNSL